MKTLSIMNPLSLLVVSGLKDIENRTWKTDYRGPLLIHSSGKGLGVGMFPILDDYPHLKLYNEYTLLNEETLDFARSQYYEKDGDLFRRKYLPENLDDQERRERYLINTALEQGDAGVEFYRSRAIVGMVELFHISSGADSPWADAESPYHWHFHNARIFKEPIVDVKGKLNLWEFDFEPREMVSAADL